MPGHPTTSTSLDCLVVGEQVLARLRGEIDISNGDAFRARLDQAAAAGHDLILDLADLTFLDTTGAGIIADTADRLRALGRTLAVVNPRPIVRRLLVLLQLDQLILD